MCERERDRLRLGQEVDIDPEGEGKGKLVVEEDRPLMSNYRVVQDNVQFIAREVAGPMVSRPRHGEEFTMAEVYENTQSANPCMSFNREPPLLPTPSVLFGQETLEIKDDDYCHSHRPPIPFIKTEVRGLFGNLLCDYGHVFTVFDVVGNEPHTSIIAYISNDNPALVSCVVDERLEFQNGDLVVSSEVTGMAELKDGKPRKVINARPYSFSLEEDTRIFGAYERGGIVTQVKQPQILQFKTLRESLKDLGDFILTDFSKHDRPPLLYLAFQVLDFSFRMQSSGVIPDCVTSTSFLPSFFESAGRKQAEEIHAYILRNGIIIDRLLMSTLLDIYLKGKNVDMTQKVLESSRTVEVVKFSAMISGYVLNGLNYDALEMFRQLVEVQLKPNAVALANVLPACSGLIAIRLGKELHGYILKNALVGRCFLESALMDMYAKCGRLDRSYQIFKNMSERDVVAWNSMISNFAQNAQLDEAITLFRQMGAEGMRYDCVTISSALSACGNFPSLRYGKEIHGFLTRWDLGSDLFVESALMDMYAKCGNLDLARCVFDSMKEKSEVSWNSIIAAYGTHGLINDAVNLFMQMEEVGFRPDHITFLHLISSCGHAGKVEDGIKLFHCMSKEYGIRPRMEHYACMIDLFGRAGRLDEALHFILDMPFKPDAGIWGAVLGACRVHGNVELAEFASKHLFEMDPQNSGYYVLMSNINAVAGRWEGVSRVRNLMKERRVEKVPGYSWIEINNTNHMFVSADNSHPDTVCIYLCMKSLYFELEEEGYVPKSDIIYPLHME